MEFTETELALIAAATQKVQMAQRVRMGVIILLILTSDLVKPALN
ncbi:hypothetical protein [Shewanella sp. FDAARGOS_354]|nr:hypothetical protein [Shewanella sp. FDAARGOS_354]